MSPDRRSTCGGARAQGREERSGRQVVVGCSTTSSRGAKVTSSFDNSTASLKMAWTGELKRAGSLIRDHKRSKLTFVSH